MKTLKLLCIFLLLATPIYAADYGASQKVDGLADVGAAIDKTTRIPCQDMNDQDKLGVCDSADIIGLIEAGDIPDISATYLPLQTVGIADDNLVEVDDADAADDDFGKFTANGLEGRSYAEVRSDLNTPVVVTADGDTDPGPNDDIDTATGAATPVVTGYVAGDTWINDTASPKKIWKCLANTDTAAVWDLQAAADKVTTITENWVNIAHPWADNEIASSATFLERFTENVTTDESAVDTTPDITNGTDVIVPVIESNGNGLITDFTDSDGNHTAFAENDWFIFRITDATTSIDFATGTYIRGNADTNFAGLVASPIDLLFVYHADDKWYCVNLNSGFTDPLTMDAKVATQTPLSGASAAFLSTFTGDYLYGGTYVSTSDSGDAVLPEMAAGMNFCIITGGVAAHEVVVATNANDGYLLDGVDTAEDNSVVNTTTAGDIACFQYYTADDWLITTNGWTTE